MAGSLLHCGQDLYDRLSVLRGAGYVVTECRSGVQLRSILEAESFADAVILTEGFDGDGEVSVTRSQSPVPVILFQHKPVSSHDFDLVIPAHVCPAQWLGQVDALIHKTKTLRARSAEIMARAERLTQEAKLAVEHTIHEISRSKRERAKNVPEEIGDWGRAAAKETLSAPAIPCPERNQLDMSILVSFARLTQILHRMMKAGPESGSIEELRIELELECSALQSLLQRWKAHRNEHNC